MSVLIKGMKMPKMPKTYSQGEVVPYIDIRIFADDKAVISKGEKPYFTEYCVIEVPPHGPLIDADEIIEVQMFDEMYEEWTLKTMSVAEYLASAADTPPTIIEAEEGEA